jgi:hypothetical protein
MYRKIWGLKQLEKMQFPYPPYVVIDISGDAPTDLKEYISRKVKECGIPHAKGDRVGVTIRVSVPGDLDKLTKHGGLHVIDEGEVLKRVLEKYMHYGPRAKVVVQHTVDARCSGTILKESDHAVIEAIFGDAPPLLEGKITNYEKWLFYVKTRGWKKEKACLLEGEEVTVLTLENLELFEKYIKNLPNYTYLEWSISQNDKLYFYEYSILKAKD